MKYVLFFIAGVCFGKWPEESLQAVLGAGRYMQEHPEIFKQMNPDLFKEEKEMEGGDS